MRPNAGRGAGSDASADLECRLRWHRAVSWLPGVGAILLVTAFMAAFSFGVLFRFRTATDDWQSVRVSAGTVVSARYWQTRKDQPVPAWYTTVRVDDGFTIPVQALREYRPGDRVEVTYLRGPAGTVVVERIEAVDERRE